MMVLGLVFGVMAAEALVVFVLIKSFSSSASPSVAEAAGPGGLLPNEGRKAPAEVEVEIGEFRAQNRKGQQAYVLDFSVFATVSEPDQAKVERAIAAKSATIKDRFSRVVRAMDPERFIEPDLTTLRSRLKEELTEVLGPDLKIQEVLLTDFTSMMES